jgi:Putative mono-oxygenase ydhR
MAEQLLQINFGLNVAPAEYRAFAATVAEAFTRVPGLRWKVWFVNEEAREAGGIYLFQDERTLNDYLASDIVAGIRTNPALRNATFKHAAVMPEVSAMTRGPIAAPVSA